jgi:6-pyruvoyltetrahydropterin/6-carboxytetrahydropterin synthase
MEIYDLYIQTHFSAAHSLRGYQGDCAKVHGHNWIIDVFVRCKKLNDIGIGVDFRDVKQAVKAVLKSDNEDMSLDHVNLSDHPAFKDQNPTSENIARYLYKELGKRLNTDHAKVSKIKVSETPGAGSYYWEE